MSDHTPSVTREFAPVTRIGVASIGGFRFFALGETAAKRCGH